MSPAKKSRKGEPWRREDPGKREVFEAIAGRKVKKGDVLTVAQVAGIMGTKRTAELIPMCHLLNLTNSEVRFEMNPEELEIKPSARLRRKERQGWRWRR